MESTITFGYNTKAGFINDVELYNIKAIPEHSISFDFSFDGWITDNCIIYNIPLGKFTKKDTFTDWACNNCYDGYKKKTIQRIVNRVIREYKGN